MNQALRAMAVSGFALLGGCGSGQAQLPDRTNFTAALDSYLAQRGHLCLGRYDWPIIVTDDARQTRSRDARQMEVLAALDLVTGRGVSVRRDAGDGATATVAAREYTLTATGRKYYLHIPVVIATATRRVTHPADFCVATLSRDRLIGWDPPRKLDDRMVTSLLFTYRIDPRALDADAAGTPCVPDGDAGDRKRRHAAVASGRPPDRARLGRRRAVRVRRQPPAPGHPETLTCRPLSNRERVT